MKNNLYEFRWDCRNGCVEGRFFATEEEVEAIIGKEVQFGEVLGKHSEVYGEIEEGEIKLLTDNQDFLAKAKELGVHLNFGYNPLIYYKCWECGDTKDVLTGKCKDVECEG